MGNKPLFSTSPDWRQIALALYRAMGEIEDVTPGGGLNWPDSVQHAINSYEYATDAESSDG